MRGIIAIATTNMIRIKSKVQSIFETVNNTIKEETGFINLYSVLFKLILIVVLLLVLRYIGVLLYEKALGIINSSGGLDPGCFGDKAM